MFTHVHSCVNYEWINIQLRVNLDLTKKEFKINYDRTKS
jgi:hypothetical protein